MFTTKPKSLAERLQWMADNLPGFAEELAAANQARAQYFQSLSSIAEKERVVSNDHR